MFYRPSAEAKFPILEGMFNAINIPQSEPIVTVIADQGNGFLEKCCEYLLERGFEELPPSMKAEIEAKYLTREEASQFQ